MMKATVTRQGMVVNVLRRMCVIFIAAFIIPACSSPSSSQADQIQAAIDVLKGFFPDRAKTLEMMKTNQIKVNRLDSDGKTLSDGMSTKTETLQISRALFSSDANFRCTFEFVNLTCTLIHEAEHADEKAFPSTTVLGRKKESASLEFFAYARDQRCLFEWRKALKTVMAGGTPPAHFSFLSDPACADRIEDLLKDVNDLIGDITNYLAWLSDVAIFGFDPGAINRHPYFKLLGLRATRIVEKISINGDSPNAVVFNIDASTYQIVHTPLIHPTTGFSLQGLECFLVGGTDHIFNPQQGKMVLVLDTNQDDRYDTVESLTDNAGLKVPASVTAHGESLFVYDSFKRKVFELLDTDSNGLPDTIAAIPTLIVPPHAEEEAGFPLFPITQVKSVDGQMVGYHGMPDQRPEPESPVAHWAETDSGFVFQGYKNWWEWEATNPYPIHPLIPGMTKIHLRGVIGAHIKVIERGPHGDEAVIGTGIPGADGTGVATLATPIRELSSGFKYIFKDTDNEFISDPNPILPQQPFALDMVPGIVEGLAGGTEITISGGFLDSVNAVIVEGKVASIVSQTGEELVFVAPEMNKPELYEVIMHVDDANNFLAGGLNYHVSTFPQLLLRRPTYEEMVIASLEPVTSLEIDVTVAMTFTAEPLPGETVKVRNEEGEVVASAVTDDQGEACMIVELPEASSLFTVSVALSGFPGVTLEQFIPIR